VLFGVKSRRLGLGGGGGGVGGSSELEVRNLE
jgi:hypothetical protein